MMSSSIQGPYNAPLPPSGGGYPEPQPQPPRKAGCSNGCKNVALGCGGMILGAALTILAEIVLIAQGVSWLTEWVGSAGPSTPSVSREQQEQDQRDADRMRQEQEDIDRMRTEERERMRDDSD